jgi:hypothetical protein
VCVFLVKSSDWHFCSLLSLPTKVSHAHAGQGKMKVNDMTAFRDLQTVLALNDDYSTVEPFVNYTSGIRVQKVGSIYTVMKKNFTGSGWKSQFGGAQLEIIETSDYYRRWADACAEVFGGLELLAVDALIDTDGNHVIIELNGTAIGVLTETWTEVSREVVRLAIDKMNALFVDSNSSSTSAAPAASSSSSSSSATTSTQKVKKTKTKKAKTKK